VAEIAAATGVAIAMAVTEATAGIVAATATGDFNILYTLYQSSRYTGYRRCAGSYQGECL
jgi:hypothetical protein